MVSLLRQAEAAEKTVSIYRYSANYSNFKANGRPGAREEGQVLSIPQSSGHVTHHAPHAPAVVKCCAPRVWRTIGTNTLLYHWVKKHFLSQAREWMSEWVDEWMSVRKKLFSFVSVWVDQSPQSVDQKNHLLLELQKTCSQQTRVLLCDISVAFVLCHKRTRKHWHR